MEEVNEEESIQTKQWLDWCQKHPLVKCTEFDVPEGILPKNYKGTLIDVKVQGSKKWGPDDKIYCANEDLRAKVARGNCVLELHKIERGVICSTTFHFLVFALRKFSGGMGDEDDAPCSQNMWQNYFIKPSTSASKIVSTVKANGEAAHISCRKFGDKNLFCIGSKNVHLLVENSEDLLKYKDGRFLVARNVAYSFFKHTIETDNVNEMDKQNLISYLQDHKYTIVGELLQPEYQHIENLSHLKSPTLLFICWTKLYNDEKCDSLCSVPPDEGIETARRFGLDTVNYITLPATDVDDYMANIRTESGYEGRVLYFVDDAENVIGVLKKKTAWYIIMRAIREKSCSACSVKSTISPSITRDRLSKRISEIQTWIGFSDNFRRHWTQLGTSYVEWLANRMKRTPATNINVAVRSQFPQLWQQFLDSHEEHNILYKELKFS